METNDSVRSRLLAQLPNDGELAGYRVEVAALLDKRKKALRAEKYVHRRILIAASLLFVAGEWRVSAHRESFIAAAFFIFLYGVMESALYKTRQGQVELLKEMKQLQLQVLELHGACQRKNNE